MSHYEWIIGISFWRPNRTILMLSCRWWRLVLLLLEQHSLHQCNQLRSSCLLNLRQLRFRLPDLIQLRLHEKCQNFDSSDFLIELRFEKILTINKLFPLLVTFFDDFISECFVLVFAIKSKIVFWFTIRDFVGSEPLSGISQVTENKYLSLERLFGPEITNQYIAPTISILIFQKLQYQYWKSDWFVSLVWV